MSQSEASSELRPQPFSAQGTLFSLDIRSLTAVAQEFSADRTVDLANRHLDHVMQAIAKHEGEVHQFIGDAVVAYWLDGTVPGARAAFACALDLLAHPMPAKTRKDVAYDLDIGLATGEIVGAYFGPIQQFQLIGSAQSVSDRLWRHFPVRHGLRVCHYTVQKLINAEQLCPIATVEREHVEPLIIHGLKQPVRPEATSWWRWR